MIPEPPGDKAKQAKHQTAWNGENTVFDAKGLVGQKFVEPIVQPIVQPDIKQRPYMGGGKGAGNKGPQKAKPKARVRLRFVGWPDD